MAKNMKDKALWQLGEKVKEPLNKMFAPKPNPNQASSKIDHNELHPDAARMAMIFFGGLSLILVMLIWFVLTCKNNSARMKKEREEYEDVNEDDQITEMQNQFGSRHQFLSQDSDDDDDAL